MELAIAGGELSLCAWALYRDSSLLNEGRETMMCVQLSVLGTELRLLYIKSNGLVNAPR